MDAVSCEDLGKRAAGQPRAGAGAIARIGDGGRWMEGMGKPVPSVSWRCGAHRGDISALRFVEVKAARKPRGDGVNPD